MPSKIVLECAAALASKGLKIAFIESATAGRMCSEFALSPHSGKILRGGLTCYEVFVKENILHVPHELVEAHSPESAEVTQALGKGGVQLLASDITVAVTGLIAPGGSETEEKPVGTMFLYLIFPQGHVSHKAIFTGSPESIILKTVDLTAQLILENLQEP